MQVFLLAMIYGDKHSFMFDKYVGILHKVVEIWRNNGLYDEVKCVWDMHFADDLDMCLGDCNGHIGRHIDGFDVVHGGYSVGQRNFEGRMLLEFFLYKELCVSNTWFKREEKRKVTLRMDENETEIDFVLIKNEHHRFIQNVMTIHGEF